MVDCEIIAVPRWCTVFCHLPDTFSIIAWHTWVLERQTDWPKMSDVITQLGRWGSTEPCVQRMASEITRPLKAGCNYSKNKKIVLKLVTTDLIKADEIKTVSLKVLYIAFHRGEGCWFFCLGLCDEGQGNPYWGSRKLCLPRLLDKLSWEIWVRNRRKTGNVNHHIARNWQGNCWGKGVTSKNRATEYLGADWNMGNL